MPDNFTTLKTTHLLWTGGWDSTFRLLQLLLIEKKTVQPYYLISHLRGSSEIEMNAMNEIRKLIIKRSSVCNALLLPTVFKKVSDIKPNEIITAQYKAIEAVQHFGNQYEYIARFALEQGIENLELSIEKYRLKRNERPYTEFPLFKNFRFPIFHLTKLDMQAIAKQHGFLDILNETVFCHTPLKSGKPCGKCNPCKYTAQDGLMRRLPTASKLRYLLTHIVKPKAKKILGFRTGHAERYHLT